MNNELPIYDRVININGISRIVHFNYCPNRRNIYVISEQFKKIIEEKYGNDFDIQNLDNYYIVNNIINECSDIQIIKIGDFC